jgi:hypothetical protein
MQSGGRNLQLRLPVRVVEVDPSTPKVDFASHETPNGRTDHVALTAWQRKARGATEVTLRMVHGRLFELEIWAGYGVRPRVKIEKLEYA